MASLDNVDGVARAHALDRWMGPTLPVLRCAADVAALESLGPWCDRLAAASTFDALRLGMQVNPAAPAIHYLPNVDPDEVPVTLSHAELFAQVTQAGNLFHSLGVGPGDVVSLLLPLVPQAFVALLGAQAAGIANPVNPLLSAGQIAEILRAAGTRVLVAMGPGDGLWAKVQAVREQLPGVRLLLVGGAASAQTMDMDFDRQRARQPGDRLVSGRVFSAADLAGYFHTGGTTGTPKLVRHTHANQLYQAWALRAIGFTEPGQCGLFGLPLFHVGGALTQMLAGLSVGGALVVLGPAGWRDPRAVKNLWRLVQRYRPRAIGSVPTVLAGAAQVPVDGADISSLHCMSGGGSAVPVAVIRYFERELGLRLLEVYGMTELGSVHCMGYPDWPGQIGSVGRPLPYSRVRVVQLDAQGHWLRDCAPHEIGVVAMAGPGAFAGYVSELHNHRAFVQPGWVNSGDLGRLDDAGELWITGRVKDLIIRGGHNIDPQAMEELLYQHPAVALAALVGQPDAYAGELPVAYVQKRAGHEVDAAALLAFLHERTPERAAVPVALHFVDAMPMTAVGKIFKPTLRVDAMERVGRRCLGDLSTPLWPAGAQWTLAVQPHAEFGHWMQLQVRGVAVEQRAALLQGIANRLDPLAMRHGVTWG